MERKYSSVEKEEFKKALNEEYDRLEADPPYTGPTEAPEHTIFANPFTIGDQMEVLRRGNRE